MILVLFQGKQFNITVIQVYALTSNPEKVEVEQFCEALLEKEMATPCSTLAWKIPWMKQPGRLQSMGSQRVRHD